MDNLCTWADVANYLDMHPEVTQAKLAKAIVMDPSQLSRALKARDGDLSVIRAAQIKRFFAELDGDPSFVANDTGQRPQSRAASGLVRRLPVFGYAAASDGEHFVLNEGQVIEDRELPSGITLPPGDYFIVLPSGSSMEPRIMAGEPQVVRRNYPPARDKGVVIEFPDGTAVIKNYRGRKDGRIWVEQFNPPKMLDYDATKVKVHAVIFSF